MNPKTPITKTPLPNIKKILMVTSGKGGVGKSTVASCLALALSKKGYNTGLLDADIYGPSIPTLFEINKELKPEISEEDNKQYMNPVIKQGIKIMSLGMFIDPVQAVIWRGPMVSNAVKQLMNDTNWGNLDYLIIDTPPGTGDILITLLQSFEIAGAIVVTTPQQLSVADVQKAIDMLNDKNIGTHILGIVENMAWFTPSKHPDEKYFIFGKNGARDLSDKFGIPIISQIPINELMCKDSKRLSADAILTDSVIQEPFNQLVKILTNN